MIRAIIVGNVYVSAYQFEYTALARKKWHFPFAERNREIKLEDLVQIKTLAPIGDKCWKLKLRIS